ncbi:hypothetical protein GH714_023035 [Hevea brasiliensis]|uniref:PHD-type domain-containing protein n=1 Tax=Hevea brasiliensis TaxID=3981 RepID=A0A6A6KCP3_HEVBR|nr:hypothetical protein GH714_023035 [Hevea brasiliensis]
MELNDSDGKSGESRSLPFDIDLNETPLSSPRDIVVAVTGDDVVPTPAKGEDVRDAKSKLVFLDINALPSEAEGEGNGELVNSGMHSVPDASSIGNSNNAPVTCSNLLFVGNQCDNVKIPGNVTTVIKSGPVDIVQQRMNFVRTMREIDPHSVFIGRQHWTSDYSANTVLFQNQSEKFLQNLREFIFDNHGILEDGWRVEFFYCQNRCKTFAVYCSPDGNKFESMFDVACHLGLVSNCHSLVPQDRNDGFSLARNRLHLHRRRKESLIFSRSKDLKEYQENLKSSFASKFSSGIEFMDAEACKLRSNIRAAHANSEPAGVYGSSHYKDGFPVQFEDFSILSVGEVDPRPSYHAVARSGLQPIPIGSTVLSRTGLGSNNNKTDNAFDIDDHEDISVQMIFSDHSPPHLDFNILTGVATSLDEVSNLQGIDGLQSNSYHVPQVWRMVSEKLVQSCCEVYKQTGVCKFFCRHVYEWWSSGIIHKTVEAIESTDALAKFGHMSYPLCIPLHVESNDELTTSCEALLKWIGQDRFGLDVDFVQEIIELLPGVHSCSEYTFLNKRSEKSKLQTVGNGFLLAKRKDDVQSEKETYNILKGCKNHKKQLLKEFCPPGKPLSSKLPTVLVGDVLQSWELLWRFSEVLGLDKPLLFSELEEELVDCYSSTHRSISTSTVTAKGQHALITAETETSGEGANRRQASDTLSSCIGKALSKAHSALLKVLLAELESKLAFIVDPTIESGESKLRKRRKKETDNFSFARKSMLDLLPINELTWPELARRYLLTVLSVEGNLDYLEVVSRESCKVFHCLQGDSGALHGSLPGVAVIEADALLLAEATKHIFGTSKNISDNLNVESIDSVAPSSSKEVKVNNGEVPEWARVLEPVRKLPTNVGARIRRCIYDALALNPPEWATKILEHSISKEVYKGNASGPTKKAVLSVLANVCGEDLQQKPNRKRKNKYICTFSEVIMKQCRKVLRCAVAADEEKVFCNLLGRTLLNTSDNDDEGLLGFPTMVPRPLDFRTIDLRLAFGAYGGSHEAFLEDVREVWHHIRTAYADQSDLIHLAETLSQNFEALYEKEVLTLVQKLTGYAAVECLSSEAKKELEGLLEHASEIPKAPWDEGVCKVCGVDKDDDNVLLCDKCDSGYHTYCLNPPLARIPEGNWYCPSCVPGHRITQGASQVPQFICQYLKKRCQGELTRGILEALAHLGKTMEVKDYWEYSVEERIFLLKFLSAEVLNSTNIREHLDQCASASADLQQKLHLLSAEWRNLKSREEVLVEKVSKANTSVLDGVGKSGMERMATVLPNYDKLMGQSFNRHSSCSNPSIDLLYSEDGPQFHRTNDFTMQPCCFHPKGIPEQHSACCGSQFIKVPDSEHQANQPDLNELQAWNLEAISIKNRISVLQDSIACLDLQLQKVSLRKDFLGRDSAGRLYWAFFRPASSSWVVVDGTVAMQQKSIVEEHGELLFNNLTPKSPPVGTDDALKFKGSNVIGPYFSDMTNGTPVSFQWLSYKSDVEIEELIQWLRHSDPMQRELIDSLLQRLKFGYNNSNKTGDNVQEMHQPTLIPVNVEKTVKSNALETKALIALEKKYGPCLEPDVANISVKKSQTAEVTYDKRMCRCECLEPIWPSRHHCQYCHWSFSSKYELKEHNDGKCSSVVRASQNGKIDDVSKGKALMKMEQGECSDKTRKCKSSSVGHEIEFGMVRYPKDFLSPYNLEEISTKFVTRSSIKELVKEIGLLGSNGIPSFVACGSPYLSDPTLKLVLPWKNEVSQSDRSTSVENQSQLAMNGNMLTSKKHLNSIKSIKSCTTGEIYKELQEIGKSNLKNDKRDQYSLRSSCSKWRNTSSKIHDSSLRPLVGKGAQILRQLKINLLDMDAALPEGALKSSKAYLEKRCAWRAFVKSTKSIFEKEQRSELRHPAISTARKELKPPLNL